MSRIQTCCKKLPEAMCDHDFIRATVSQLLGSVAYWCIFKRKTQSQICLDLLILFCGSVCPQ